MSLSHFLHIYLSLCVSISISIRLFPSFSLVQRRRCSFSASRGEERDSSDVNVRIEGLDISFDRSYATDGHEFCVTVGNAQSFACTYIPVCTLVYLMVFDLTNVQLTEMRLGDVPVS